VARFRGRIIGRFQADVVVNGAVILELKAARALSPAHKAQTLNYLRASVLEVALLMNFGPKPQFKRLAFSNDRKSRLITLKCHNAIVVPRLAAESDLRSSALICGS
jgi:hypothetical protein